VKPTATSIGDVNVQSGFVITRDSANQYLQFAYTDSGGNAQVTSSLPPFSLAGSDPNYPLYQFEVTTTTSTANLVVFTMSTSTPGTNTAALYTAALAGGSLALSVSETLSTLGGNAYGVSVLPVPSAADVFNFLLNNAGLDADCTAAVNTTLSPLFTAGALAQNMYLSTPQTRSLCYRNQAQTLSYASYFQSSTGTWTCLQWAPAAVPVTLTGIPHRIDALLTSGYLLSTEGGTLRLYNPAGTGTQVYAVPLNGLQFCYEAYVGSTPYVFFSLPLAVRDGWAFNVYATRTSDMPKIGG
ncbi:MAG TPA: hypothetical protein VL354_18360, partial [Spirochaetia bacterium]|nr:hypothetical protein [Spirochaetia bacterium]